jgi:hypothetical protein
MPYGQRGRHTPAEQQRRERLRLEAAGRFARGDIYEAFLTLACAIICWRRLRNLSLCQDLLAPAAFAAFLRCRPLVADLAAHRIGDILEPGGYHDHRSDDFGQLDMGGPDRGCVAGHPQVQGCVNRRVQVYGNSRHV